MPVVSVVESFGFVLPPLRQGDEMTEPLRQSITHLDWTLSCNLKRNGVTCTAEAVWWTENHCVAACTHPAANEDGNIELLVCDAHKTVLEREAARLARHYNPGPLMALWTSRRPFCPTCGRPVQHAGDVLQISRRIDELG